MQNITEQELTALNIYIPRRKNEENKMNKYLKQIDSELPNRKKFIEITATEWVIKYSPSRLNDIRSIRLGENACITTLK